MNHHLEVLVGAAAQLIGAMDAADCLLSDQVDRNSAEEILKQLEHQIARARMNLIFRKNSQSKCLALGDVQGVARDLGIGG